MGFQNSKFSKDQIEAATALYEDHLPDWKLRDQTLNHLKAKNFDSKKNCLLKVVVIDSLYGTGLRFHPGRWERVARWIHYNRTHFSKSEMDFDFELVKWLAEEPGFSFASKFCHFFVCESVPIFDRFACDALCHPNKNDEQTYVSFCKYVRSLADQFGVGVVQLDRFLWLIGYCKSRKGKRKQARHTSEVDRLFDSPSPAQKELLAKLTACECYKIST